ncbi:hypothetical protein VTK73DRAFT_23 [Phialemonium thermophilum]|uniref:RING-CH-type domain-containing protein n=1 Tax=Phialemonium thermophilum TaxID=223376 RepID=A0ABR3YA39_9PEZI
MTDTNSAESADGGNIGTDENTPTQGVRQANARHYKPRTCRICLEVVQPTTETSEPGIGSRMFGSKPRVTYISEDPELGRLLSPCRCKGSQKYVHEGCLQAWRQSAPLSERNFWRCPTCQFEYRIERLRWGRWVSSRLTRGILTLAIVTFSIFLLGFVADPIINLWLDPIGSIADTIADVLDDMDDLRDEMDIDEPATWSYHFLKGLLSLGLLGFLKTFLAMSPWHWFNVRVGGARRRGTGRDRLDSINWVFIIVGLFTFMGATWKLVSLFSARILESVSERVVDIQSDDDQEDDEAEEDRAPPSVAESKKDI